MLYDDNYKKFIESNPFPRKLKSLEPAPDSFSIYRGENQQKLVNFSSSDYLGLSRHPLLIQRSHEFALRYGVGSGSSRLVSGNLSIYAELEQQLAKSLDKPAALIFGPGYQTNISVLEALLDRDVLGAQALVFCDRLAHVSMLATTRHIAKLMRFQHNNFEHLRNLLEKYADSTAPKFILVESVYSMDGDAANLVELKALANQYNAFLYVDDAHAVGVYGSAGWGLANETDFVMGTFSKGLGSYGAYVGCSESIRDYLINKCKGFIYSTAPSPAILGAISAAIELLPQLNDRRQRVIEQSDKLRAFFRENGLDFGHSTTHIVPWIIGDAKTTVQVGKWLEEEGILGTAIQPPSVPLSKSRIRFCITASQTDEDFELLLSKIRKVAMRL